MQAMFIVALVFAILAKGVIMAISIVSLVRKRGWQHILIVSALGTLALGDIFTMIAVGAGSSACGIIAGIFWLLGWPVFAAGVVLLNLALFRQIAATLAAPAAEEQK